MSAIMPSRTICMDGLLWCTSIFNCPRRRRFLSVSEAAISIGYMKQQEVFDNIQRMAKEFQYFQQ